MQKLSRTTKKQKQFQQILIKRISLVKHEISIFYLLFINYHGIIDIFINIYCYLIDYPAKKQHLSLFHDTNKDLKPFCVNKIQEVKKVHQKNVIFVTIAPFSPEQFKKIALAPHDFGVNIYLI